MRRSQRPMSAEASSCLKKSGLGKSALKCLPSLATEGRTEEEDTWRGAARDAEDPGKDVAASPDAVKALTAAA